MMKGANGMDRQVISKRRWGGGPGTAEEGAGRAELQQEQECEGGEEKERRREEEEERGCKGMQARACRGERVLPSAMRDMTSGASM